MVTQELAKVAALKYGEASGNAEAAVDPATIMVFAQIIMDLIAKIRECKKSQTQALSTINSPSRMEKIAAKLTVRKQLGRKEWRDNGDAMLESVINTGAVVTPEQLDSLYDEAD